MTAPLSAISAIGAIAPADPISPLSVPGLGVIGVGGGAPAALDPSGAGSAGGFGSVLVDSLRHLQNLQTRSDELAVRAADGDLQNVHDYTIAATEAALATQLTVAVRDKALAAFNEIMRMQG